MILLVEDDVVERQRVAVYLRNAGLDVLEAGTAAEMREMLQASPVRLVLLDIGLPDGDGFLLARELRAASRVGLIFLTGRTDPVDAVVGLELGADDYLTKPVNLRILQARIRSLSWRMGTEPGSGGSMRVGELSIDRSRNEVRGRDGVRVPVTRAEFALLQHLAAAAGQVVARHELLGIVGSDTAGSRSIDTLISRLRVKLAAHGLTTPAIQTIRGTGYRLS